MRTICAFTVAFLVAVSSPANAVHLKWSNGATSINFTQQTQCRLFFAADSGEALPQEWRLMWQADSSGVNPLHIFSGSCSSDTAGISWFETGTSADSGAHQFAAHLCSQGSSAAPVACFIFDQPGGSRGKFKVAWLDPDDPDSTRVLYSNTATFNGGVSGDFPPIPLRTSVTHTTTELQVRIIGANLSATHSIAVGAVDDLWSVPLTITSASDTMLSATADLPTTLPPAHVKLTTAEDLAGFGESPGDGLEPEVMTFQPIIYRDPDPNYYPKDFSLFCNQVNVSGQWKTLFHLMYIRQRWGGANATYLAHAWSDDNMQTWHYHIKAFQPGAFGWDTTAVWAPSMVQIGDSTYMFYTGVDKNNNQTIGYASTALYYDSVSTTWDRKSVPVYRAQDALSWAVQAGVGAPAQFRDPFVIRDPSDINKYLLFNVGLNKKYPTTTAVGVARNVGGSFRNWTNLGHYDATDSPNMVGAEREEGPSVMRHPDGDATAGHLWRLVVTRGDYTGLGENSTYFRMQATGHALTDTSLAAWTNTTYPLDSLYHYVGNDPVVLGWSGSEYLSVGNMDLIAGWGGYQGQWGDSGIVIAQTNWPSANDFTLGPVNFTGVAPETKQPAFHLVDYRPGDQRIRMQLDGVSMSTPRVMVYDVAGRRVRDLADGLPRRGPQEFVWDCSDAHGTVVRSGMYFVRLTGVGRQQVLRIAVFR